MIEISCFKRISENFVLDANLSIKSGAFVALYGKSGSGKTTLLRMLAGFLKPEKGVIKNRNLIYFNDKIFLPPQKRNIGYLFQDYALFPNMNVKKNLLFANNDKALANELLGLVGLIEHENSSISELSGGQKQRVALARALMRRPEILLLDEPLSALDNEIRRKLQDYLLTLHARFGTTTILVSHDVSEIYRLASKVYQVENGRVTKIGTPTEIFLKTAGSQKFSLHAKILEISKRDSVFVAIVEVANQICEVVLNQNELSTLQVGDEVIVSAKAFKISIKAIK